MLSWLSRDGKILLMSRIIRAIGYGFLSVVLAIYLSLLGLEEFRIGVILAGALLGGAMFTILASLLERRLGRRGMLILLAALMSVAGSVFLLTTNFVALLVAALIGTINATGTEVGPFLSIEQAIIPQTCDERRRTLAFALYNTGGSLATSVGALLSGLPSAIQRTLQLTLVDSFKPVFALYILIAGVTLLLYASLSGRVEASTPPQGASRHRIFSPESRWIVTRLSALFALDAFAGGFVIQSVVAYWFFARFEAPLEQLSVIFSTAGVLTALSFLAAARLAGKIGLINTMVFTHIPSNVLLMAVPLAPTFPLAIAFYLARMGLSQMDVPTRQSYTVAIVEPEERVAASGFTNTSRNVAQAVSPSIAGYALQFFSLSFPFVIGGVLKIFYDILLYAEFRGLKSPEERSNQSGPVN